jgi:hypothetical protein
MWHGMAYHQGRKRQHPSWFRKELIFACAGHKGLKRLDEIWYQTWVFVINIKIEGDMNERLIRAVLGLEMTVEKVEHTEGGQYDALTKRMLHLRNEISWSNDGQAGKEDAQCVGTSGNSSKLGGMSDVKVLPWSKVFRPIKTRRRPAEPCSRQG